MTFKSISLFRSSAIEVPLSEMRPVSRLSNQANQSFIHQSDFNQSINNPPDLNQSIDDPSVNNNNNYNIDGDKREKSDLTTSDTNDKSTNCDKTGVPRMNINSSSVPLELTSVCDTETTRQTDAQTGLPVY